MKRLFIIAIGLFIGIVLILVAFEYHQHTRLEDVNADLLSQLQINVEPYATDTIDKCVSYGLVNYLSNKPCPKRTVSYFQITDFNSVIEETAGMRASLKKVEFGGGVSTIDVINKTTSYFRASRTYDAGSVNCNISIIYPFDSNESDPYRYVREKADSTLMIVSTCRY